MTKKFLKKIIVFIITAEAKFVLKKYHPRIVAITGTVGKTSTKDAIHTVLKKEFSVRKTIQSYNSEIGVPLVILGCKNAWFNPFWWLYNILQGLRILLFNQDYPRWLVLELGVERPSDMAKLISWIRPDIAVMTALTDIPAHVEYFSGPEALIKEKSVLLRILDKEDYIILNGDDPVVCQFKDKSRARIVIYGFGEGADLQISNYKILFQKDNENIIPLGITFKMDYRGNSVPFRIYNAFGKHHAYPVAAAIAVGLLADLNLVEMSEYLADYESPAGRLKLIDGVKNSFILDDTYNASPLAVRAALEALKDIPAKRKIAVLGDMLELGKYTIEAHKSVAQNVLESAEIIFTIGPRSKFLAQELKEIGFEKENIFEFSTSDEAKGRIQGILKEGDLILVKGSQSMRMERIVEEIMAYPEKKEEFLVRQDKKWKSIK